MKTLQLESIVKSFDGQVVLESVSIGLQTGHMNLVVGPSGSGKSTLARVASGLLDADSGRRMIDHGQGSPQEVRGIGRDIQFVFQNPFASLNPARTVGDALSTPLRNYLHLNGRSWIPRASELLEKLGLTPAATYLERYPHQLSGGQKQRVVLARSLAAEPTFLIADEPTAMLDQSLKHEVYGLFRSLADNLGIGVLMVTHDLLGAQSYADNITVLDQGQIIFAGPPSSLATQSDHSKVTRLIEAASFPYPKKATNQ